MIIISKKFSSAKFIKLTSSLTAVYSIDISNNNILTLLFFQIPEIVRNNFEQPDMHQFELDIVCYFL
ncbi:hypothetical protein ACQKND_09265 [Viridibacillus arvi]|uniref:hypothetical protein n=1 Tax=Viridibacillus arvi TaxID=263475 RepID=UPI003D00FB46